MAKKDDNDNLDRKPKKENEEDNDFSQWLNRITGIHVASTSGTSNEEIDSNIYLYDLYETDSPIGSEGIGSKRPNTGILIGKDGKQDKGSKKAAKGEKKGHFDKLKALINDSVKTNFKKFDEKTTRLTSNEDNRIIQGLEAKIYEVLKDEDEDENEEFENEKNLKKQSFLQWAKVLDRCDGVKAAEINSLKKEALRLGIHLSRMLVDIMFYMSHEDYDEMMEMFLVMETALEWVVEGEKSVVIPKILEIIRAADIALRDKKRAEMLDNPSTEKEVIVTEEREESLVNNIIFRLMKEIFRLELCWMHQGLPDCEDSVMNEIKNEIEKCELNLVMISSDICDLLEKFLFGFEAKEWKECAEYEAVDANIVQLWDGV